MSEIGSPGIMHDVDLTVQNTPTTPRQSMSSSFTTPRQHTYAAFEEPPLDTTNPLHGLHVVQVDNEHFFARWRYKSDMTMESWHDLLDTPWLRNVRSERTYGLVPERETIILCRYIVFRCLCATALRGFSSSEDIDLVIYICHNPHTQAVSVRCVAEGTQAKELQHRPMGFDLVTGPEVQTCTFDRLEPWMNKRYFGVFHRLLEWDLIIVDESGLQPFTWPSNDEDVQRAQFFTHHFSAQHVHEQRILVDSPW